MIKSGSADVWRARRGSDDPRLFLFKDYLTEDTA